MSIYIPKYQHDIFVSYAPVDNEPYAGANKGWVTTLVHNLKIALGRKLGHPDAFSLWMDEHLHGNVAATPDIIERLENSAILLLVLSPAYLVSEQCQSELTFFTSKVGQNSGRVFVVEIDKVKPPAELSDLRGYPFWIQDDDIRTHPLAEIAKHEELVDYHRKLSDLTYELVTKLNSLKEQVATEPTTSEPTSLAASNLAKSTVFLAEVTTDLEKYRQDVKYYLNQHGIRVLPEKKYLVATIQQDLDQDLQQSRMFVQLLSEKNDSLGLTQFQYEHAQIADLPILQWRDLTLDVKNVQDSGHKELLQAPTVIATELVYFQETIIKQLQPKTTQKAIVVTDNAWVFVNATSEDKSLASKIKEVLDDEGIEYSLPLEISADTQPMEIREDLEQNLLACDAVIIPYAKTPVTKVRQYLIHCRRMQAKREQPLKIVAIFDEPLPNKSPVDMNLCNVQILECPTLQASSCIPQFIRTLRT